MQSACSGSLTASTGAASPDSYRPAALFPTAHGRLALRPGHRLRRGRVRGLPLWMTGFASASARACVTQMRRTCPMKLRAALYRAGAGGTCGKGSGGVVGRPCACPNPACPRLAAPPRRPAARRAGCAVRRPDRPARRLPFRGNHLSNTTCLSNAGFFKSCK